MYKKYISRVIIAICLCGFTSCDVFNTKTIHMDLPMFTVLFDEIKIDSILKKDTSYYKTYMLLCDGDTILQYKYTKLMAPNRPIKAHFLPGSAFDQYKSGLQDTFLISPSVLVWENPQEYSNFSQMPEQDAKYYTSFKMSITSIYEGNDKNWILWDTTDVPAKIYYYYDWLCKMHHDYMQFNADGAVVSFDITRAVVDTVTQIDSLWMKLPDGGVVALSHSPSVICDTIDLLKDTTYTYQLRGFLKGQACGSDIYQVQTHKGEIVSPQDMCRYYKGKIYEYDE